MIDIYVSEQQKVGGKNPAQRYVGYAIPNERAAFTLTIDGPLPLQVSPSFVFATATDDYGNGSTSEFNQRLPLVFVPGMAGSRLVYDFAGADDEYWLGRFLHIRDLSLFPSSNPSPYIYAVDALRFVHVGPQTVMNYYGPLLEALDRQGYTEYRLPVDDPLHQIPINNVERSCDYDRQKDSAPDLFVFPYDRRLSNAESAANLATYINNCVRRFYPDSNIDLLAHSNGSLVARRYMLDHPNDHHVDKVITLAAPWLGAPKAVAILDDGDFLDDIPAVGELTASAFKYVVGSMRGVHQLLPSRDYADLDGNVLVVEEGRDWNGNGKLTDQIVSYDEFVHALDKSYGHKDDGGFLPGTEANQFHTQSKTN